MKTKTICLTLCLALALLSGCSAPSLSPSPSAVATASPSPSLSPSPTHTLSALERVHLSSTEKTQYAYSVEAFDVAEGSYVSAAGRDMPYHINGIMGVPEGDGPFPLVLITHGSHSNDDESLRFDTGYTYLVETLAKQGIIAVSMDLSKAYIWKYGDNDDREKSVYLAVEHVKHLMAANQGETSAYPFSLAGKIDFDRTALAGHSRGGEAIFDIAQSLEQDGLTVASLLGIAPTFHFSDRTWPSGSVAMVVPEYDGDVISLDGLSLYDKLNKETSGEHMAVYLKKANHNYFNANITRNDALMRASSRDISDQLTREEQEAFLQAFASDFFFSTLQNGKPLLSADSAQPDTMYDQDVAVRYQTAQNKPIFLAKEPTEYTAHNMTAELKTDAWFFKLDELLADTVTYGDDEEGTRRLLKLNWSDPAAVLSFTPQVSDWQAHRTFILDLVVDPSDEDNAQVAYQQFTVRLTDANDNTASVTLPESLEALKKAPGFLDSTPLFEETLYFWSIPTPLTNIIMPLEAFEGIDFSQIKLIELVFADTPSGSLLLETLRLQ